MVLLSPPPLLMLCCDVVEVVGLVAIALEAVIVAVHRNVGGTVYAVAFAVEIVNTAIDVAVVVVVVLT